MIARDHGFGTWAALRAHVAGLAASGEPFHQAFLAIRRQDPEALGADPTVRDELYDSGGPSMPDGTTRTSS